MIFEDGYYEMSKPDGGSAVVGINDERVNFGMGVPARTLTTRGYTFAKVKVLREGDIERLLGTAFDEGYAAAKHPPEGEPLTLAERRWVVTVLVLNAMSTFALILTSDRYIFSFLGWVGFFLTLVALAVVVSRIFDQKEEPDAREEKRQTSNRSQAHSDPTD